MSSNSEQCPIYLRCPHLDTDDPQVLQQDLTCKPFYESIMDGGLYHAYAKQTCVNNPKDYYQKQTKKPKHVLVVGAGMAGLSAAYELRQTGHQVTILELQNRVGGRVKTFREPFAKGLHAEGGAMRLPNSHYLTHHYIKLFNIKTRPFQNVNKKGFFYFYGDKIKMSDWDTDPGYYCNKYWEGWDKNLTPEEKKTLLINDIDSYWEKTIEPLKQELVSDISPAGWNTWVEKWSKMSVQEFLETDIHQDSSEHRLRPWPLIAIEALKVHDYSPMFDCSLVEYLREIIGDWWKDPLSTPAEGLDTVAWAFMKKNTCGWNPDVNLSKDIQYGIKVLSVERVGDREVKVVGQNVTSQQQHEFTGDAVILTVPLTVLRNMEVDLTIEKQRAIANVRYEASTKIFLQCKTRFWQKPDGLQGGFSKTNLPIGHLHYPDWSDSGISAEERGVLMVYTWGQDALIFGAQTHAEAIENAVKQVAKIHKEITEQFEVGAVQAWYSDPTSEGALACLKPNQYNMSMKELVKSDHPIYLAGEAISWSNGWIQGAMQSGLRAAYQFFCQNEETDKHNYKRPRPGQRAGGKRARRE
ncbi:putative L-amino-acid oxidase YobN isoform X1 [Haliotis rufescens]|uniref:putative L-amino-acid oxidase YobN isoform X1 n=1 Tax=Haliotis rufescens TaxID=6454 RepID=UPI00201ED448|nr:putative L-amino-acid oxidase YobN isoform X1 [Haliotis rufescens]XP_048254253.1 putative L-amino-acid oxidase YobN isoform X1 [Haliotis rufescens]